ncbi:MAG: 7TM diverse intracellular signaling domain-containing protein [Saprospiraceae bacterium]
MIAKFSIFILLCFKTFDLNAGILLPEQIAVEVYSGMYNVNIESNGLIYFDRSRELTFESAIHLLTEGKFKAISNTPLPNKYVRGQFNNWIHFSLHNEENNHIPVILNAALAYDSIFILKENNLIHAELISRSLVKDSFGILNTGFPNAYFVMLPGKATIDIILKHYAYDYSSYTMIPKISDVRVFESKYFRDNNNLIFFYSSGVFFIITLLLIFGFQWLFSSDKVYLWYSLYCLASLFVIWRNLEGVQPYFYSTTEFISWTDSKVFHSIAVFYTYIVFCATFLDYAHPRLKTLVRIMTWLCIVVTLTEVICIMVDGSLYMRWILYKLIRIVLTILGIIALIISSRAQHPMLKYVVAGGLLMAIAEIASMFSGGQWSSTISLMGVYADFVLFAIALGIRANMISNEKISLKLENLRLSSEKEMAASQLKTRIANDIHDEIGAGLTSANFVLHRMSSLNNNSAFDADIKRIRDINDDMVTQMHDIIWSMDNSKDKIGEFFSDLRLVIHTFLQDNGLDGKFTCNHESDDVKINGLLRRNLLMSIKETLTNVANHSGANRVDVNISVYGGTLKLYICDNGKGFNETVQSNPMKGNGIKNIIKRVKDCGGDVKFYTNKGAVIDIIVPVI